MSEALIVLVRGIIGFFTLLIFARILGKQQISQLTFFDYVLGITIGSTASTLTTDLTSSAWAHWVGLLTWAVICFAMQLSTIKSKTISSYIDGEPTIVVMNGKIMEDAMKKMRFRLSDLLEQLRTKDVFDLKEVQFAVLEKDGQLSVLKKPEYLPVTPKDMNLYTGPGGLTITLIYDGTIIPKNLKVINKDKEWLTDELRKKGINDVEDVFMAAIDKSNSLYIDLYKDFGNAKSTKQ
ncbi:DUF421 domain-containing protein [Clostridium aciditolerans]|uniref:DUF421 domain-containing protein n=1 Tax=Clostridium aciditolerans TaxID=339861 RepID=A0A934HW90_9CLOT|nr:DUF421 domain-containing protein [Clostridium aciditolerans]MBI6871495.1 DUF421 domain-containing protein [Clostridium aciditolerans]